MKRSLPLKSFLSHGIPSEWGHSQKEISREVGTILPWCYLKAGDLDTTSAFLFLYGSISTFTSSFCFRPKTHSVLFLLFPLFPLAFLRTKMPPELKDSKNGPIIESVPRKPSSLLGLQDEQHHPDQSFYYKRPSFLNRIYLSGVIHRPNDLLFLGHGLISILWTLVCLLLVDLPFLITTRFHTNSERHPVTWGAFYSFCMSMSRACSSSVHNVAQLRLVSNIITWFVPVRMLLLPSNSYSVKYNVQIKVHLNTLLEPERKTLAPTRARLNLNNSLDGTHRNPVNPSSEYLASFLPDNHPQNLGRLANLPEESGALDEDGTYTLRGEWIEALDDPIKEEDRTRRDGARRPSRSNVVILYCHGGGHVFCSASFHREVVTRMLLEVWVE